MYVDIVETLSVTLAPSGRPLSALANGTIAFTSKVSGVPDLLLQLGCPGGISNTVSLPVFHPSVRLGRWKERPGELSFVPPDGRFVLAGYEVDLLGSAALDSFSTSNNKASSPKLNIPGTASISTSLGPSGADFEVRLQLNPRFSGKSVSQPPSATGPSFPSSRGLGRGLGGSSAFGGAQGTTAAPVIEEMSVNIPLPASVKNVSDMRIRGPGDAVYAPGGRSIEWKINSREISTLMGSDRGSGNGVTATLRGTVVGQDSDSDEVDEGPVAMAGNPYEYEDEASLSSYQTPSSSSRLKEMDGDWEKRRIKLNKVLMPSCATVSFKVKGWLASGIKVEGLSLDVKKSKGLGAGVTPYKGVKYLCVSERGVESRC
jgi:AP-3 complex subunit mu